MAVLVGIDEAGYGPLLGPLVVSSAVYEVPAEHIKADLWDILRRAVGKHKKHLAGRLLVADSKKAYSRSSGVGHLRRTVISHLFCTGRAEELADTAGGLFELLCRDCFERLGEYPWYASLAERRLGYDAEEVKLACAVLSNTFKTAGVRLVEMSSRCMDVAQYNQLVSVVKNKASVLFTAVCSLIQQALDKYWEAGEAMQVIVDRQGGRINYADSLQKMFGGMSLKELRADEKSSSYEMTSGGKIVRIHFVTAADDKYLPVSLASMTSKYIREILVECMNEYFLERCCNLRPTAGYWKDGQRFVAELRNYPWAVQYDRNMLVRMK